VRAGDVTCDPDGVEVEDIRSAYAGPGHHFDAVLDGHADAALKEQGVAGEQSTAAGDVAVLPGAAVVANRAPHNVRSGRG
jgi:hypothetical protein